MKLVYLKKVAHRTALQIGATVLAACLVFYMGYHIWRRITSVVTTDTALPVTVESLITADGYLFRDELYISARENVSGAVIPALADGERVAAGGTVARLYDNYDADVVSRLTEIDEQIAILRASRDGSLSLRDLSRLDGDIQDMLIALRYAVYTGDYSATAAARRELITGISKRQLVIGKAGVIEDRIAALEDEAADLTRRLGVCREVITAAGSGYYFRTADGYEQTFTAAAAEEMTLDSFRCLTSSAPTAPDGRTVGKMSATYVWYVSCEVPRETAARLTTGETYTVGFPYNRGMRLPLTLVRTDGVESGGDTAVLVFRSEVMPEKFTYARSQPVEIVETEYTGFRIPISAIRVLDEVQGVYILDGSVVRFRAVSVLATVDDTVIVDPSPDKEPGKFPFLTRNDNVIISGKGLYDGRILS